MAIEFRSGDALFAFDGDMTILSWNQAAEELTGIPQTDAVGKPCWEVVGGVDEHGSLVCHSGCSGARLAGEGWPVRCQRLLVKTGAGGRKERLGLDDRRPERRRPGLRPRAPERARRRADRAAAAPPDGRRG